MPFKFLLRLRRVLPLARLPVPIEGTLGVAIGSLLVAGGVQIIRNQSWIQGPELKVYDHLVRFRPVGEPDPRLLIVGITETDIRAQRRWPLSDQAIATALSNLEQHQPRVIGLDLYREVPQEPGSQALARQLQSSRVVVITKLGNNESDRIPPPDSVAPERIGFNDLPIDIDGVVRRALLFASNDTGTYPSFALQLVLPYLAAAGTQPQPSPGNPDDMMLGQGVFVPLKSTSGAYLNLDDRGYQILLNYRADSDIARVVTLSDVLNNRLDPNWVRNKIVLVGTYAPSIKDLFYTPYSAGEQTQHQMPGVAIHAQVVSQILDAATGDRPLLSFWTERQEWFWIWGWAVVGSVLAWRVRHPLGLMLGAGLMLASLAGSGFWLLTQDTWVPLVAPAIAATIAVGSVTSFRAQQSHRQQQMVMKLLGQNASPEIAEALWISRDRLLESGKLPGQRLIATMLFTDIRGFSTLSEQMPPETLLDWLNEYLEAMTHEIQQHHGIINKFTGDGLLAVFGVPMPRLEEREIDQDAHCAVACALAMGDRLQQLNQLWVQRGLTPIQMRVGIFTGPVVVGSLGGKDRLEYGVIGDSVNVASRLESCAKERQSDICRVLIAKETLVHLQEQFEVESWGPMELRGKQQAVEVYRVLGWAEDAPTKIPAMGKRENR